MYLDDARLPRPSFRLADAGRKGKYPPGRPVGAKVAALQYITTPILGPLSEGYVFIFRVLELVRC